MAKSGFWLRGAKGKLAGSTIYKGKQGTVMREIVTPTNPKSQKQMLQRSRFVAAVKFYKHAQQKFFPFAFEGKKSGWSEFNAFMNANSANGVRLAPAAANCATYPALGRYVMTDGSLPQIEAGWNTIDTRFEVPVTGSYTDITIGEFSTNLLAKYPSLQEGDIVTIVAICATEPYSYNQLEPESGKPILWEIKQFKIDKSSTEDATQLLDGSFIYSDFSASDCACFIPQVDYIDCAIGFNICVSRVAADGSTLVSRSVLQCNSIAGAAITAGNQSGWISQVLSAWNAKDAAILQGGTQDTSITPVFNSCNGAATTVYQASQEDTTAVGASLNSSAVKAVKNYAKINGSNLMYLDSSKLTSNKQLTLLDHEYVGDDHYIVMTPPSTLAGNDFIVSYNGTQLFMCEVED